MEGDTGHALALVLIQPQNGMERIALGQISPQKAAIGTNVKVDRYLYHLTFFLKLIPAYFDAHLFFSLMLRYVQP